MDLTINMPALQKILATVQSCKTVQQVRTCKNWIANLYDQKQLDIRLWMFFETKCNQKICEF